MKTKGSPISWEKLAGEVKAIYHADPQNSQTAMENFLNESWKEFPPAEQLALLEKLTDQFKEGLPSHLEQEPLPRELSRLFSLLLGKRISMPELSSEEFLEKLAHSLNTVFDTLNQIVGVIHTTLLGKKEELETIRLIIGSSLGREDEMESLKNYLDQIKEAFLVAHRAFNQAAHTKINEILKELNPDRIAEMAEGGLDFGPFHKAKLFEIYKAQFAKCQNWFASGRLIEELLREFEKNCKKLFVVVQRGQHGKIY